MQGRKTDQEKENLSKAYVSKSLVPTAAQDFTENQKAIFAQIKQYLDSDWIAEKLNLQQQEALGVSTTAGKTLSTSAAAAAPAVDSGDEDDDIPALFDGMGDYYN